MEFLRFDEVRLVTELARLPKRLRAAFAAACAERLLPSYARYSKLKGRDDPEVLAHILASVWDDIERGTGTNARFQGHLEQCMAELPEEEEGSPEDQAYANDAVASVAYAIRSWLTDDGREAMWAARRAYDAVDHFVVARLNPHIIEKGGEARILAHPVVQAELQRQESDLAQLRTALGKRPIPEVIADLRGRAQADAATLFDARRS